MSDNSIKNKRIAKNTLLLYFRMLFLMLISLYTSRVILDGLGVEDYGIYNVVGGFVSMFAIVSAALTSATTRFINYEQGKGDINRQTVVFSTSLTIQVVLTLIVLVLCETFGVWYIQNVMVVPEERLSASMWCFQFSVITFCANLITVPYNASIIAHERMSVFAGISIFEGLAKLAIAFCIFYNPIDRLVFYALLLLLVQLVVCTTYHIYCFRKFEECKPRLLFDRPLFRSMLGYSVWHFVGNGAQIAKTQGVNLVLNYFCGPVLNTARGISNQIEGAVSGFASNFMMALNPQITISYAKGDNDYLMSLVNRGSKLSFFLLTILSLPVIINADFVLGIWLKEVPEYAVEFTQLSLICSIIASLSRPLMTAQNATGNVRNYQLIIGSLLLLNLPFSYIALLLGFSPISIVVVALFVELICLFARIFLIPQTIPFFKPGRFIINVVLPCAVVMALSSIIPTILKYSLDYSVLNSLFNITVCLIASSLCILFIGCSKSERLFLKDKFLTLFNKQRN